MKSAGTKDIKYHPPVNNDRINYSLSMKISTHSYENVTFSASLSSDVLEMESTDEAWLRVIGQVETLVKNKVLDAKEKLQERSNGT